MYFYDKVYQVRLFFLNQIFFSSQLTFNGIKGIIPVVVEDLRIQIINRPDDLINTEDINFYFSKITV